MIRLFLLDRLDESRNVSSVVRTISVNEYGDLSSYVLSITRKCGILNLRRGGSGICRWGVLAAMCREGSDFSFQVTGVPLGKRSLDQLLNDGDKVVERTDGNEPRGFFGAQ